MPLRTLSLNSGPFPPPALPGFVGSTDPSATPSGPIWPSRASGCGSDPHHLRLPVLRRISVYRHAVAKYPGGTTGSYRFAGVRPPSSPVTAAFPVFAAGRLPRYAFRGLLGVHCTLRPACSRSRHGDPLHRRLRRFRCLHRRSDCYRLERPSCRAGLAPAEDPRLFTAHAKTYGKGRGSRCLPQDFAEKTAGPLLYCVE